MRFHRIKIENLNSLSGTHEIDLEGVLSGAGLFLIHGPTGAGKSTILDAICLALYGKTPRLDAKTKHKVVGIDGVSPNDPALIMTRGTGSSRAEVEFSMSSPEGRPVRYRATWYVQRARKNPTGAFQKPERSLEVFEEQSGWRDLVAGSKKGDIDEHFGRVLQGLSFEDFQRTTLLAQFAFRQFLEADEKQRGELLARMTDGDRFKEIGKRAYLARKAAEDRLKTIDLELGGKAVLSEDEVAERSAVLARKQAEVKTLDEALAALGKKLEAWSAWQGAKERLESAEREQYSVHEEREARAVDLETLAVDRQLSPARQALDELERRVAQRDSAQAEVAKAEAVKAEAVGRRAQVAERQMGTAKTRAAASEAYESRRSELELADKAWSAWKQAQETLAAKEKEAKARELAWTKGVQAVEAILTRETGAHERLVEIDTLLGQIPQRELLLAEVSALEDRCEAQKKQRADIKRKTAALDKKREDRDRLAHEFAETSQRQASLEEAWVAAKAEVVAAEGALATLLGGAKLEEAVRLNAERKAELNTRIKRLEMLDVLRGEVVALSKALDAVEVEVARTTAEVEAFKVRVEQHEAEEKQVDERLDTKRREVELLGKVMHLVEQRSVLMPEHACPLCGSVEHPYVEAPETAPDSAHARAELETAQASLGELTAERARVKRALETARKSQSKVGDQASTVSARAASQAGELVSKRKQVADEELALGLGDGPTTPEREAARAALEGADRASSILAERSEGLRAAKSSEERARIARDQGAADLQRAENDLSNIKTIIETEESVIADAQKEIETAAVLLQGRLEALEIREPLLTTGVADARKRADRVKELTEEKKAAEAALTAARLALSEAEASRFSAAQERDRANAEHAAAEVSLVSAKAALHYEGRDPATVRAELESAEKAARLADEQAVAALAAEDTALASAEATLHAKVEAETKAKGALHEAEQAFESQRLVCGAASAEDVRKRSLDEAKRAELSALEERLAHRQTAVAAKVEDAGLALSKAEVSLQQLGEEGEASTRVAELETERGEKDATRSALQQDVGALRAELERNAAERAAQAELRTRRDAANADYEQWKLLAELIGTEEGKAFADLVQALNLSAVIERANARLAGFMERYELTQVVSESKMPRLDFLVVDRFQDNARRGTKSLSGGESFIVSLALALGLADLRSSRLRIDTLLIDEGFGSLDQKTLQDVLAALSALQEASGAQIGLISHVDAMKEVIPAQIEVVPLGDGRSKVEVRS